MPGRRLHLDKSASAHPRVGEKHESGPWAANIATQHLEHYPDACRSRPHQLRCCFTEGPLWHPDGYWYFVDLRRNQLLRLTPGKEPELVRTTIGGNGTTFDLLGRLIVCEGDDRRLTRMGLDGKVESLVDNCKGGRFNRPNDVICHSKRTLFCCAHTSVYTLRVKVPGNPHPWYKRRGQ